MIVCHCHAVSDRSIRQRIRDGHDSVEEIGACCGAGTGCGGCVAAIEEIVDEERALARGPCGKRVLVVLQPDAA